MKEEVKKDILSILQGSYSAIKEIRRDPNKIQLLTNIPSPRRSSVKKKVKRTKRRR